MPPTTDASPAAASGGKVLDAEFTHYELSMPLVGACWLAVIALVIGFSTLFGSFYSFLRVVPFLAAAYGTFLVYQVKRPAWIWLMGGLIGVTVRSHTCRSHSKSTFQTGTTGSGRTGWIRLGSTRRWSG